MIPSSMASYKNLAATRHSWDARPDFYGQSNGHFHILL